MPPTMGGVSVPYESGQSGTERAASFDVTNAPAISRINVQMARNTANRCVPGLYVEVIREISSWIIAQLQLFCRQGTMAPQIAFSACLSVLSAPSVVKFLYPTLAPDELASCPVGT